MWEPRCYVLDNALRNGFVSLYSYYSAWGSLSIHNLHGLNFCSPGRYKIISFFITLIGNPYDYVFICGPLIPIYLHPILFCPYLLGEVMKFTINPSLQWLDHLPLFSPHIWFKSARISCCFYIRNIYRIQSLIIFTPVPWCEHRHLALGLLQEPAGFSASTPVSQHSEWSLWNRTQIMSFLFSILQLLRIIPTIFMVDAGLFSNYTLPGSLFIHGHFLIPSNSSVNYHHCPNWYANFLLVPYSCSLLPSYLRFPRNLSFLTYLQLTHFLPSTSHPRTWGLLRAGLFVLLIYVYQVSRIVLVS